MRIFLNGLGASAGAGLTYLYNVVPLLASRRDVSTSVLVQPQLRDNFERLSAAEIVCPPQRLSVARRFYFEQTELPAMLKARNADVLVSAGNFALRNSPVPQILLSGNSLYLSKEFYRDVLSRRDYRVLTDTTLRGFLAKKSVRWSDCTVAPSAAFAEDLRRWTGREVATLHHGFDYSSFTSSESRLPVEVENTLCRNRECFRLLFVSHYNYYRNFETLFRALPILQKQLPEKKVKLFLTCKLENEQNPGTYDTRAAVRLIHKLGTQESVEELGAIPYDRLHHLYRACDIYVTAAYTETFAHPLVEAMASGLPVIASDLRVHREICRDAALYFPVFDCNRLAERISLLANDPAVRETMSKAGLRRAATFSWREHVERLLEIAAQLMDRRVQRAPYQLTKFVGDRYLSPSA